MAAIYEFNQYPAYLQNWIETRPGGGRGVKKQMADALEVSPTLITFIVNGSKAMNLEQASDIADFLGLGETETDYLFLLVEFERAGHERLRKKILRKIKTTQEQAQKISTRLKKDLELNDTQKAIYYSSWLFTGIRNLVATGDFSDAAGLAKHLHLPLATVAQALQFLLENQLVAMKGNKLDTGPSYTHVDSDSPFVNKHRQNWRLRGMTVMEQKRDSDLFYVSPMSLSKEDAVKIRKLLLEQVDKVVGIMRPSPSEVSYCLNIDWFEY